jgi:hypothetical protein
MNLRCRVGDMAVVIKGHNSGRFVTVLQGLGVLAPGDKVTIVAPNGQRFMLNLLRARKSAYYWLCEGQRPLPDVLGKFFPYGAFPDPALLPLRPPAAPMEEIELLQLESPNDAHQPT